MIDGGWVEIPTLRELTILGRGDLYEIRVPTILQRVEPLPRFFPHLEFLCTDSRVWVSAARHLSRLHTMRLGINDPVEIMLVVVRDLPALEKLEFNCSHIHIDYASLPCLRIVTRDYHLME